MSKDEILDAISNMTVIELKELLDAFEEKFDVTAAAPVAVAAAGAPAAGGGDAGAGGNDGGFGGFGEIGACSTGSDFAALAALIADGSGARMEAASLALSQDCLRVVQNQVDFTACVADGLQDAVLPEQLSNECAQCYGDLAWCSRPGACNLPCSNDACNEIQCRMCPGYPACENILATCTGRTPDECSET